MILFLDRLPLLTLAGARREQDRPWVVPAPVVAIEPYEGLGLPLIGNRLLSRAGIRLEVDYRRRTLSLWLPASRFDSLAQWPRRLFSGYAAQPIVWQR